MQKRGEEEEARVIGFPRDEMDKIDSPRPEAVFSLE